MVEKGSYSVLPSSTSTIQPDDVSIVCGDLHSHIGKYADGFEGIHGGYGYGRR